MPTAKKDWTKIIKPVKNTFEIIDENGKNKTYQTTDFISIPFIYFGQKTEDRIKRRKSLTDFALLNNAKGLDSLIRTERNKDTGYYWAMRPENMTLIVMNIMLK